MSIELFRKRAVDYKADRLSGEVLVLPRLSHTLCIALLLLWIAALAIWLITSSYTKKETVTGWLEPNGGLTRIYAEDSGVVQQLLVKEGDQVSAGQPLAVVSGDRYLTDGERLDQRLLQEYQLQRQLLSEQLQQTDSIFLNKTGNLQQQLDAARQSLDVLQQQLATLNDWQKILDQQVDRQRTLQRTGHLSSAELEDTVGRQLALRNQAQSLQREQVEYQHRIDQLNGELLSLPNEKGNSLNQIRTQLSTIAQKITQLSGAQGYVIKAPREGIATNLQIREGMYLSANKQTPLMTLVPPQAELVAHLLIPVKAAGFIKTDQPLDIRYDAFPYQKFGLYQGRVTEISEAVFTPGELADTPVAVREPVYQVAARLAKQHIQAYGQRVSLKPGMTFSADIQLSERSLLQWLLEPIFSLQGRL